MVPTNVEKILKWITILNYHTHTSPLLFRLGGLSRIVDVTIAAINQFTCHKNTYFAGNVNIK
jgi:hypothetical protein